MRVEHLNHPEQPFLLNAQVKLLHMAALIREMSDMSRGVALGVGGKTRAQGGRSHQGKR
jgi:hypothetical protein